MRILADKLLSILVVIVNKMGYAGIMGAAALEYACFPISSEILLPFIGYTASKGEFTLIMTIISATIGGVLGSFVCYLIGRFGRNFFRRFMKYKGLKSGMEAAKKVFDKYGKYSVFLARIFPIARTYVSIPAGISGMKISEFIIFTAGGAFIWNTALISIGYVLGENYLNAGDIISGNKWIFIVIAGIILFFVIRKKGGLKKISGIRKRDL